MSSPSVQSIYAKNDNTALANLILVLADGTEIGLDPGSAKSIHPSKDLTVDLTQVSGLNIGDTFTIRVKMYHSGQTADDDTSLTYVDTAGQEGKYDIAGTASAPTISYTGVASLS